jgi:hypothetical protein
MSLRFATKDQGTLSELPAAIQIWLLSKAAVLHRALVAVNELGIADFISDGPRTTEELARATSSHAPSLFRALRLTSSMGISSEVRSVIADLDGVLPRSSVADVVNSACRSSIMRIRRRHAIAMSCWWSLIKMARVTQISGQCRSMPAASPGTAIFFMSPILGGTSSPHSAIVPEYDDGGVGTRVVRYPLDESTLLLKPSDDGYVHGSEAYQANLRSMQGATAISGKFYISSSHGVNTRGSIYAFTGTSDPNEYAKALPEGPEDFSYWQSKDELWTLAEHPGNRSVLAVRASSF